MEAFITAYCKISHSKIHLNAEMVFATAPGDDLDSFLTGAYRKFVFSYPKFFKMDSLCKLAFIASELLINSTDFKKKYNGSEVGIVLSNHSSSFDSDHAYHKTMDDRNNYFPSPSVFVYTLPNIMIGEISIRQKFTGENAFFISEKFDPALLSNYAESLLETGCIESCISGWVEANQNNYEVFVFLVEKNSAGSYATHDARSISALYLK